MNEELTLTKQGIWLSNGEEIQHGGTRLAFSRSLYRGAQGVEIRIGAETKSVLVEDTLYFVTALRGSINDGYKLFLNDGRKVDLDPTTLEYRTSRLSCKVAQPNENSLEEAKFLRAPYYELLSQVEQTDQGLSITIQGSSLLLSSEKD